MPKIQDNASGGGTQELLLKLDPAQKAEMEAMMGAAVEAATKPLAEKLIKLEEDNAELLAAQEQEEALKAFADTLPPAMQEAFLAMTPEEQDAFQAQFVAAVEGAPDPMAKIAKGFEDVAKANKELQAKLQKMEDEREQADTVAKFQSFSKVLKVDEFATNYRKLHKAHPEATDALVATITALVEQQKTGDLFKAIGGDGDGTGMTAREMVAMKAEELVKSTKVSKSVAIDTVLRADPELYQKYLTERSA